MDSIDKTNSQIVPENNTLQILRDAVSAELDHGFPHAPHTEADTKPEANNADTKIGGTTIKRDSSGNTESYSSNGLTLAKHEDSKWYLHQDSGGDFVEVDANSIKMDDKGTVRFDESGLFGKSNQSLGGDNGGILNTVTSAVEDIASAGKIVGDNLADFGKGTMEGFNNSSAKVINDIAGTHLPDLQFSPDADDSVAGSVGEFFGELVNPIKTVNDAGHAVVDLGKKVYNWDKQGLTDIKNLVTDVIKNPSNVPNDLAEIRHHAANFGYGMLNGALDIGNGTTQFINQVADTNIPEIDTFMAANMAAFGLDKTFGTDIGPVDIDNQEIANSVSGQMGDITTKTAVAAAVALATHGAGEALGAGVLEMMALEAGVEGTLGFVTEETMDNGKNPWQQRIENFVTGASAGAASTGLSEGLEFLGSTTGNRGIQTAGKIAHNGHVLLHEAQHGASHDDGAAHDEAQEARSESGVTEGHDHN